MKTFNNDLLALGKAQFARMRGGRVRGELLLVEVELTPVDRMWVFGRLRNQYQSQRQSPRHPEGWEPITADGFVRELEYDLKDGWIELPAYEVGAGGVLLFNRSSYPARVFRYREHLESAQLKRREARVWNARFRLLRAIKAHWTDARIAGTLAAEHLGIKWQDNTGEPLATRLMKYAYALDEPTCRDLTALLNVVPQPLAVAA